MWHTKKENFPPLSNSTFSLHLLLPLFFNFNFILQLLSHLQSIAFPPTVNRVPSYSRERDLLQSTFNENSELQTSNFELHLTVFLGRFTLRNTLFAATENVFNPVIIQMISKNGSNSFHPHKHWVLRTKSLIIFLEKVISCHNRQFIGEIGSPDFDGDMKLDPTLTNTNSTDTVL